MPRHHEPAAAAAAAGRGRSRAPEPGQPEQGPACGRLRKFHIEKYYATTDRSSEPNKDRLAADYTNSIMKKYYATTDRSSEPNKDHEEPKRCRLHEEPKWLKAPLIP